MQLQKYEPHEESLEKNQGDRDALYFWMRLLTRLIKSVFIFVEHAHGLCLVFLLRLQMKPKTCGNELCWFFARTIKGGKIKHSGSVRCAPSQKQ